MSLRTRIVLLVGFTLVACAMLGAAVIGYQVRRELAAEIDAALAGAQRAAAATFEDLPRSDHPGRDLQQLVQTYDGDRHLALALVADGGRAIFASQPSRVTPAPAWFRRLVEERRRPLLLPIPQLKDRTVVLVLAPRPDPDISGAWRESVSLIKVVGTVSAVGLALVWLAIGAGLRPLRVLDEQFARLGAGDYTAHAVEAGPPELRTLQRGFNDMTRRLGSTVKRNQVLGEQLARLQDEERAEIARDLHDEIGPRLFAIGLDAALIAQLCVGGRPADAAARAREIQQTVGFVQGQVRDLLGWLRPARLTEFGLSAAITELVSFWTTRRPDIAFAVDLAGAAVDEAIAEVSYRVVQEAVSNAVRHAAARRIDIAIALARADLLQVRVTNDGLEPGAAASAGERGFGLLGMRERVEARGGTLLYGPDDAGSGWIVQALLPLPTAPVRPASAAEPAA